jgi:hypothetical protein
VISLLTAPPVPPPQTAPRGGPPALPTKRGCRRTYSPPRPNRHMSGAAPRVGRSRSVLLSPSKNDVGDHLERGRSSAQCGYSRIEHQRSASTRTMYVTKLWFFIRYLSRLRIRIALDSFWAQSSKLRTRRRPTFSIVRGGRHAPLHHDGSIRHSDCESAGHKNARPFPASVARSFVLEYSIIATLPRYSFL